MKMTKINWPKIEIGARNTFFKLYPLLQNIFNVGNEILCLDLFKHSSKTFISIFMWVSNQRIALTSMKTSVFCYVYFEWPSKITMCILNERQR